jgi:DNA polymerase III subunit beta
VEIGFNAGYLVDFLRASSEEKVSFHFKDPNSAGELRPGPIVDGDPGYKYRYVVMPMRI